MSHQFEKENFAFSDEQKRKFLLLYEMLVEKNKVMNLTGITKFPEVVEKHFLDSILLNRVADLNKPIKVIDVGTGAGFPGIPLKIAFPHLKVTLLDSLNKRVNFLNVVKEELNLNNVTAVHSRVEDFCSKKRNTFDIATARAVASLPTLLEYLIPLVKVGGGAVCYKSLNIDNELNLCKNAFKKLYCELDKKYDYNIDGNFRSIVTIKSYKECNKCYPRSGNKPKLKPL